MRRQKPNKPTVGQKLWLSLYRAQDYSRKAERLPVAPGARRLDSQLATKAWLEGMADHMKRRFSIGLRTGRERLGITQQQIAEIAEFSPNAVAMIERGERVPNLETAARLCWALDIASGATAEEIGV